MRKYYLFGLFLALTVAAKTQVRIGLKAGVHNTTARVVMPDGSEPAVENSFGFHGGIAMKIKIEGQVYFVPQIQYAYKTYGIRYNNTDTMQNTLHIHYVEIPLLLEWKKENFKSGFFVQFGPSFSIAISGKEILEGKSGTTNKPMNFSFNSYGRGEANLVVNAGYQFGKSTQFTVGYAHGLGTLIDDDFGPSIKPRMFTASLLYWFD